MEHFAEAIKISPLKDAAAIGDAIVAVCNCNWASAAHPSEDEARAELDQHVINVGKA